MPLLLLAFTQTVVFAQDSQAQYTFEEYAAYESAVNADPSKREEAIIEFIKANPKSALVQYTISSYLQLLQEYQNTGQTQKVLSAGEKLLTVLPDELNTQERLRIAAYELKEFDKAAEYGEKVFAQTQDGAVAKFLFDTYTQLNNEAKYIEYGEQVSAQFAPKDSYETLGKMARIHYGRKEWGKAAEYAGKVLEGLDTAEKPPEAPEERWESYVNSERVTAYKILGRQAWERKQLNSCVAHFRKVLSLSKEAAVTAEAHYYTGRVRWDQRQMDSAMEAFAKGSVQKGAPHAEHCQQHLETLYKSTHNGSLAGLEEFVERVTGR